MTGQLLSGEARAADRVVLGALYAAPEGLTSEGLVGRCLEKGLERRQVHSACRRLIPTLVACDFEAREPLYLLTDAGRRCLDAVGKLV